MISTARSMHCPKGAISGTATIMLHLGMGIKTFSASLFPIASAMRGVTSPKMEWGITIGITPAIIWDFPAFSTMAFSPVAPSSAPAFSMAFVARALVPRARIVTFFSFDRRGASFSTSCFPMPPPCPSIMEINIFSVIIAVTFIQANGWISDKFCFLLLLMSEYPFYG